jgi:superfamily II DNA or RNA helicase
MTNKIVSAPAPDPSGQAVSRTRFAHDDLLRIFDARTLKHGRSLILMGAVTLSGADGKTIEGIVSAGTFTLHTTVTPSPFGNRVVFTNSCSCGRSACAHVAATALTVLDQYPDWRRPIQQSFLDDLVKPVAQPEQRQILFDLEPGLGNRALFVSITIEISGARTSRSEKSTPNQIIKTSEAHDADRAICRLLGGSDQHRIGISASQPQIVEMLLKRLLASGRSRWKPSNKRLIAGPHRRIIGERRARAETISWPTLPAGSAVIQGGSTWYVDAASGEIGIAELHIVEPATLRPAPPRAVAVRQPAVKPTQPQAMPTFRPGHAPVIVEEAPIPVLNLTRILMPGTMNEPERVDAMRLSFDYRQALVEADDERQFVRIEHAPDDVVFIRRDRALELKAQEALREMGFGMVRLASGQDQRGTRMHTFRGKDAEIRWQEFAAIQIPALKTQGWRVEIGEDFGPQLVQTIGEWDVEVVDTGDGWFSLEMGIDIEGERHPLLPILTKLLDQGGMAQARIVDGKVHATLGDGRLVALPADRVDRLLATLKEMIDAARITGAGKMMLPTAEAPSVLALEDIIGARWHNAPAIRAYALRLNADNEIPRVDPPPEFRAALRPYQQDGLDWLQHLRTHDMAGILADDMGLGKTAQTLAHIAVEHAEGRLTEPALIVVPTSLVANWASEAVKFVPFLKVLVLHGLDRHERRNMVSKVHIVVTTYSVLARDIEIMAAIPWHLVVLDEAQAIKNPDAKATRAACRLKAAHRLCLSGTPIENNLSEIWSLFAFLMPSLLGDRKSFTARFRTPIEKRGDVLRSGQLARRLKPFMLRRTKAEVATDLPPKTEIIRRVDLDTEQRDLYETIRLSMHDKIRGEIAAHSLARSQIVVLDALLKLRQVCCDPRLVKLEAAQKVSSAKLDCLMEMLNEMVEEGRRVLVFSQFTSMLDLIKPALDEAGIRFVELTGRTVDRAGPVQSFQAGEVPVFLISLKAGGKGLNLTAADTVIHYDPWWNPAVERQATDRAYRIGQDKPVFVYKLVAAGTVEERILEMQERKGDLAATTLDGAAHTAPLDAEDIDLLFAPPGPET